MCVAVMRGGGGVDEVVRRLLSDSVPLSFAIVSHVFRFSCFHTIPKTVRGNERNQPSSESERSADSAPGPGSEVQRFGGSRVMGERRGACRGGELQAWSEVIRRRF